MAGHHPESGKFWLHRWRDGKYETVAAHVRELSSLSVTNQKAARR